MAEKTFKSNRKKSQFREWTEAIVIAILLALFIRTFIIQAFKIPSGSMKPTLLIGDHLLVNKFIFGIKFPFTDQYIVQFKKPKKGDIIVFKWPRDETKDFIKRVIGIEGDKVEIKLDQLFINGEKIESKKIGTYSDMEISHADKLVENLYGRNHFILDMVKRHENFGPKIVPKGSVFVMGDNRDNSLDSRGWGFVSTNKIRGKALIIYWSWPHWNRFLNLIK